MVNHKQRLTVHMTTCMVSIHFSGTLGLCKLHKVKLIQVQLHNAKMNWLCVDWDVLDQWSLLDPNVTDEIRTKTTTFRPHSIFHVEGAESVRRLYCCGLSQCMDPPEANTAPYSQTMMMQPDLICSTCELLVSEVSCALIRCSGACNRTVVLI